MSYIIKAFSGKIYNTENDWSGGLGMNAEDGETFNTGKSFLEVFFKDFFVRGNGNTFKDAEELAWSKYIKIKNCKNHEFKRLSDSGLAVCIHCSMKTNSLENQKKCKNCNKVADFYIGYDTVCAEHFKEYAESLKENLIKKDTKKIIIVNEYLKIKYIESKNSNISSSDIYRELKKYHESYNILMSLIEEVDEKVELNKLFDLADNLKQKESFVFKLLAFIDETESKENILEDIRCYYYST